MWFDIGLGRLILLVLIFAGGFALGKRGRRWLTAVAPLALIAALAPGTDPLTMLLALAILLSIFGFGVFWGSRVRAVAEAHEKGGELAAPTTQA